MATYCWAAANSLAICSLRALTNRSAGMPGPPPCRPASSLPPSLRLAEAADREIAGAHLLPGDAAVPGLPGAPRGPAAPPPRRADRRVARRGDPARDRPAADAGVGRPGAGGPRGRVPGAGRAVSALLDAPAAAAPPVPSPAHAAASAATAAAGTATRPRRPARPPARARARRPRRQPRPPRLRAAPRDRAVPVGGRDARRRLRRDRGDRLRPAVGRVGRAGDDHRAAAPVVRPLPGVGLRRRPRRAAHARPGARDGGAHDRAAERRRRPLRVRGPPAHAARRGHARGRPVAVQHPRLLHRGARPRRPRSCGRSRAAGGRALLLASWGLFAIGRATGADVLPSQSEDPFPLLVWQLLFVHGAALAWHRDAHRTGSGAATAPRSPRPSRASPRSRPTSGSTSSGSRRSG